MAAGYPFVERRVLLRLSASGDVLHVTRFNATVPAEPGRRDGFMAVAPADDVSPPGLDPRLIKALTD